MKQPANPFATEAELCAAFIPWARHHGWTAYAETAGWDLLMVNKAGIQLGVHAKLAMNLKVVAQCLESGRGYETEGPDFRAVLVGAGAPEGDGICEACGLAVFRPVDELRYGGRRAEPRISFDQPLPDFDGLVLRTLSGTVGYSGRPWHPWNPVKRHPLPAYIPDVAAGVPGPVQLTPWKVKALQLCAVLELRGHVTRADFRELHLDHRPWTGPAGWLTGDGEGRWKAGAKLRFPDQHPQVYLQILAEAKAKAFDAAATGGAYSRRQADPTGQDRESS